ncbi:MAG: SynChlorMet cassette radical SAM/SPASM protein ScmE [Candidatus Omnitrophica bacterium]|nr:SynChlorMet cassette radical SAM/SPASM protein ScmE [Candidatus Omnitrophota bacterium]
MKLIKTPQEIEILITSKCNLFCKYCSNFDNFKNIEDDLSTSEWLEFFSKLSDCAVMRVTLSGGEPLLRGDLKELIQGIIKNKMRFSILTNGSLITEDIAKFLALTNRCDYVQISIDGVNKNMHDSMRGEGSFQKAIEGINILKKYNVSFTIRVTVHKGNFLYLEEIASFLFKKLNVKSFSINSASYLGLCKINSNFVCLNPTEYSIAIKSLLKLDKIYPNRIKALAGPLADAKRWIFMHKAYLENKAPTGGYLIGCKGIFRKLAVRADGVIIPCVQLSHINLGKINKDSLKDIWNNHPKLNEMRERKNISLNNFSYCRDCIYINYCTGNCPAIAYTMLGDINKPSPEGCLKRFLEEGGNFPDEYIRC